MVGRRGTPLRVRLSPASRHGSLMLAMLAPTLDAVPGVRLGARPCKRPNRLHGL